MSQTPRIIPPMRYLLFTLLLLAIFPFLWVRLNRPIRTEMIQTLSPGVTYQRHILTEPNTIAHLIKIDLSQTNPIFQVTPSDEADKFPAIKTTAFSSQFDVDIAINGSFYQLNRQTGDLLPIGLVISDGVLENNGRSRYPALCVSNQQTLSFHNDGNCPPDSLQGIAGNVMVVQNGRPLDVRNGRFPGRANAFRPEPRTAVGLSADGQTLFLVVIDGRQGNYSTGMTMTQLAEFMVSLGVENALNLDGGGSSTLVTQSWHGPIIRNSPIHNGIPTLQRPIPTHLGITLNPTPVSTNSE